VDAAAGTGPRTGGNRGSPAGLIAGAAAVAVLAAGAGVVARRRRRTA
jgi:LPXTG-motif cell wall-anchored protein